MTGIDKMYHSLKHESCWSWINSRYLYSQNKEMGKGASSTAPLLSLASCVECQINLNQKSRKYLQLENTKCDTYLRVRDRMIKKNNKPKLRDSSRKFRCPQAGRSVPLALLGCVSEPYNQVSCSNLAKKI